MTTVIRRKLMTMALIIISALIMLESCRPDGDGWFAP